MNNEFCLFRCNIGCGFDKIIQGGSVGFVVWETSLRLKELYPDLEINILLPLSGKLKELQQQYNVEEITEMDFEYHLPLTLNPDYWDLDVFPKKVAIKTKVYRIKHLSMHIYLFSNEFADSCSNTLYPYYQDRGKSIYFYKQLFYQTDCYHFIKNYQTSKYKVVHIHDINNAYLLCALSSEEKDVSTVVSIIDSKIFEQVVYEPLLRDILREYHIYPDIPKHRDIAGLPDKVGYAFSDPGPKGSYVYENYLIPQQLVFRYANAVTADSQGHFEYITSYEGSALEPFYKQEFESIVDKMIANGRFRVASLGIFDEWFQLAENMASKSITKFAGITFFHNARLDVYHKGQFELFEAVRVVVKKYKNVKFIISLVTIMNEQIKKFLEDILLCQREYPENVILIFDDLIGEKKLPREYLATLMLESDFVIAPSKGSLESFCFAIGEAMLFGAIPLISGQKPLSHWLADYDEETRMQLTLPNSIAQAKEEEKIDPLLTQAIINKVSWIVENYSTEKMNSLKKIAKETAKKFHIKNTARVYYDIYDLSIENTNLENTSKYSS